MNFFNDLFYKIKNNLNNSKVYRTDLCGSIIIRLVNNKFKLEKSCTVNN